MSVTLQCPCCRREMDRGELEALQSPLTQASHLHTTDHANAVHVLELALHFADCGDLTPTQALAHIRLARNLLAWRDRQA